MSEIVKLRFEIKPNPVLPDHRPIYKIAHLCLILYLSSRGKKSSFVRLHLFNWALKRPDRMKLLEKSAYDSNLSIPAWGFDPALVIAIKYAMAEGLVKSTGTGLLLSENGENFANLIINDQDIFTDEKMFFQRIGLRITEKMVDQASKNWAVS